MMWHARGHRGTVAAMRTGSLVFAVAVAVGAVAACGSSDTKLKVTGIDPEKGDVEGGTYVKIYGNRFINDGTRNAKVYFGSHKGTVIRFASDSQLIVETPGGKPMSKVGGNS